MGVILFLFSCIIINNQFSHREGPLRGLDRIRIVLVALCILIIRVSLLLSIKIISNLFIIIVVTLTGLIIMVFILQNLFYFYIFFEISLLPILYIIIRWGYQPERLQAGVYLILYTVGASLPILASLFYVYEYAITLNYYILKILFIYINHEILAIFLLLALIVKIPIYLGHLWLPKAHVEAPLAGSIILAGLLLKLGGYGIIIIFKLFTFNTLFLCILISLRSWGGIIARFLCITKVDIKAYVAYTSVAHISLVLSAILVNNIWGLYAAKITMIAHGYTSSLMFVLASIRYNISSRRSLLINKGMLPLYPTLRLL